jgi:hypothetical protein
MWGRVDGYLNLVSVNVTEVDLDWLRDAKVKLSTIDVVRQRRKVYRGREEISALLLLEAEHLNELKTREGGLSEVERFEPLVKLISELSNQASREALIRRVVRREYLAIVLWFAFLGAVVLVAVFIIWMLLVAAYFSRKYRYGPPVGQWDAISSFWPFNGKWLPWQ